MEALVMRVSVFADSDGWGHMWDGGGGWMWLWGSLMMLFWVAVIGLAIYWLVRATQSGAGRGSSRDRAEAILAERYARGELTTEEYRERSEALR